MHIDAATCEAYFAALPEERRAALTQVRRLVIRAFPRVTEELRNGLPTYFLDGTAFCALGNQKSFMALYIMHHDLLDAFNKDLKAYDHGRSCIRFRRLEPETNELFDRIIKYTGSRFPDSRLNRPSRAELGTR
ncbi:MAG: DUF1801 domain-containing protein [Flavobacteriales bacterium]|nr:DUF1801 domain-containing protein [Flavobacteriales bacterium]MBK7941008.1 DUF1801 domain-containing protein [Flavobacteriales bacterium]MBK8949712.1 DUF1801 domain-containing protein [Flavobacteriales bacterium]MBK9701569.1 DUF1801 domain-containing protein [Flavobacteriales bacterium]